jgi:hypothetical protein
MDKESNKKFQVTIKFSTLNQTPKSKTTVSRLYKKKNKK